MIFDIVCARCGTAKRYRGASTRAPRQYCSQQCWLKVHNNPERNKEAAIKGREKNSATQRSKGLNNGRTYTKLFGRHEHRRVAEEKIGRPLLSNEIVHHLDHNKRNNHPDNLEVVTRAEHCQIHFHGRTLEDLRKEVSNE